jgi:serine/threonine protein kinase
MADRVDIVIQSGGDLINQGSYGCIFNPPLTCKGEKKPSNDSKKLGKLTEISDLKNEISVWKLLSQFPDSKHYVILPQMDTLCKPSAKSIKDESGIDKCEPMHKYGIKNMMQFELEYGGKTLRSRVEGEGIMKIDFFDFMREMLELGTFMALHGCIHNDIHSNNIVMLDIRHPRLIDFGRSYIYNNIDKELVDDLTGVEYAPNIGQIPPEITIHQGLHSKIPVEKALNDIHREKNGLVNAERVLGLSRTKQMSDLRTFWDTSKSVQSGDWVGFYRMYWPKVDSWAIGANLLNILKRLLLINGFASSKEWLQRQAVVKDVLRRLMRADPRNRIDCVNALSIYDPMNALLSAPAGKAWLAHPQA